MSNEDRAVHVFVDNSNIFGGAKDAAQLYEEEPIPPWPAIRVYWRNFFRLLHRGRRVETREFAGSVPPGNDEVWNHARRAGYTVDLLNRVEDAGSLVEQGVDELLHLRIALTILDHKPGLLVLATGDGSTSDYDTSFVGGARRALERGWQLEVWSWERYISNNYFRLEDEWGDQVSVNLLDTRYFSTTFVQGGSYTDPDTGDTVQVEDRVVSKLPDWLVDAP